MKDLSIVAKTPLAVSSGTLVDALLVQKITSLSFTKNAIGGYGNASLSMNDSQEAIEDWIANGLGRHIEVYNPELEKVYEGFVNEIDANLGSLSVRRGPLLNIGNRVRLMYSTVDTSTSPPTLGIRATTGVTSNTDSQGLYGIFDKVLSTGGVSETIAPQIRDSYIEEYAEPETSQSLNISGGSGPSLTFDIRGYNEWLFYPYNSTTTGTQNLSDKIEAILGADPNSIISTDYSFITSNTLAVGAYDNDNRIAKAIILELLARGDSSDNRYIFGVYNDRIAEYNAIPTTFEYQQRLNDPGGKIFNFAGLEIRPWDVEPGKWLLVSDFLIGQTVPTTNLRDDQRAVFIESLTYTAPYGLQIQGGKSDKLSQKLAKLGLAGIGA